MAENINININAKDNASTTIGKVKSNLAGLNVAAANTQKNVQQLNAAFLGFRNVIGGLAIGAVVTSAFRLADGMVDVANATNLSTQSILGFSEAVALNGGDMASAQQALVKFTQSLGDAKNGATASQQIFAKLGVSISELQTLSEQDILRQTVQGLGSIENAATRAAATVDVFGRSFARVDIASVNSQLDEFVARAGTSAQAVEQAGEVQGRLNDSFAVFQIELLAALGPLSEFLLSITSNQETIKSFMDTIINLGKVIGAVLVLSAIPKLLTGLGSVIGVFDKVDKSIRTTRNGVRSVEEAFGRFQRGTAGSRGGAGPFAGIAKQVAFTLASMGPLVAATVAFGAALLYVANIGIRKVFDVDAMERLTERVREVRDEVAGLNEEQAGAAAQQATDRIRELNAEYERLKNIVGEIDLETLEIVSPARIQALEEELDKQYDLRNVARLRAEEERKATEQRAQDSAEATRQLEAQRVAQEAAAAAAAGIQSTIDTIAGLKEELMLLGLTERQQQVYNATKQAGANATLEELSLIQSLAGELYDLTEIREQDAAATEAQVQAQQEMNQAIAQLTESYQDAISGAEAFVKNKESEYQFQNQINETYGAARDFLEQMAEFDQERISNLEQLKVAAEAAAASGVTGAMAEYDAAVQLYDLKRKQFEELARLQAELNNSATKGAKDAMANIGAQFTPYQMAQEAIQDGWNKIGSAVDNFIETGKFSFKDFARSVIADLGAMIAKAMIFNAIKTVFGSFGIPGLAAGGPAQAGKPYMVGEQGPELFVPKQSGTVIPNNKLGSGTGSQAQPTNVTNNVYNISAVDAKSVAQLFYENRKTMLGTMNIAQKELPYSMG
jgi:lambda family phage tail tape measure protein